MTNRSDIDEYTPEIVRYWLQHWTLLESASQGGSGGSGFGAGRGDRMALAAIKADLECAADRLPLHWQSTAFIFQRQRRNSVLRTKRALSRTPDHGNEDESPIPSAALEHACYRMARALGWQEGSAA